MAETGRNFDNFINKYIEYTDNTEGPRQMQFWTAISVIAGALSGKCKFKHKRLETRANFYIVFVGEPGVVKKSTTLGYGMKLLKTIEGINIGPDSGSWQAIFSHMQEIEETVNIAGRSVAQSNLMLPVSELGTLLDLKDESMVDVFTDLWDGAEVAKTRKTMGGGTISVESPWINMIGCTTPDWIKRSFDSYTIGGGLASRVIFVLGKKARAIIAYPEEDESNVRLGKRLAQDLKIISKINGTFRFTDDTAEIATAWYEDHKAKPPSHLKSKQMQGYASRKQTHIHKLCMCLSAAESSDKIIHKRHFLMALKLLEGTEKTMHEVYEGVTEDRNADKIMKVKDYLVENRTTVISKKELFKIMMLSMGWDDYERAVNALFLAGYVKLVDSGSGLVIKPDRKILNTYDEEPK